MFINYNDIPHDLEDMIDEGEFILSSYSKVFEEAMFFHKLLEHGTIRRSHRIITDKCIGLGTEGTIELLTGKTMIEIYETIKADRKEKEIKAMYDIADKYGYSITRH